VLSNNDGCAIARSNEAKQLGIKMGQPYFQFKKIAQDNNVYIYSSNFKLYTEMSNRVMQVVSTFSPLVEYYSIDEAFIKLPTNISDYSQYIQAIRDKVLICTGIPVSIGLAKTKTLAKLATHLVKNHFSQKSTLNIFECSELALNSLLNKISIENTWGIGRQISKKLQQFNVSTVYDFKRLDKDLVKQVFSINELRTHQELNGVLCLPVNSYINQQKSLVYSRSFSRKINQKNDLFIILSSYITIACNKLRKKQLVANYFTVYLLDIYGHFRSKTIALPNSTNFTTDFLQYLPTVLSCLYSRGLYYKKAGLQFDKLISAKCMQLNLLEENFQALEKKQNLYNSIDSINTKFGENTLTFSSALDKKSKFKGTPINKSPDYLSDWQSLIKIRS
jgi:DNA polymerase V